MRKPSPGTVIALVALFVALGGPAQAAKLISGSKIKKNTITTKQIKNRTITSGDISSKTLKSLKRKSSAIGTAQITDGSITLADLAFGSVTGNQVVDRSLSAVDIANDSLTQAELGTDSVGNAEIADDAVTNREIKTSAVTKGSIKGSSIGTGEVIDRDLTAVDISKASGKVNATFSNIDPDTCTQPQSFSGAAYNIPAGSMAGAVVLANAPADGVHVNARATNADSISLQVCNDTDATIASVSGDFPYLAFAP